MAQAITPALADAPSKRAPAPFCDVRYPQKRAQGTAPGYQDYIQVTEVRVQRKNYTGYRRTKRERIPPTTATKSQDDLVAGDTPTFANTACNVD